MKRTTHYIAACCAAMLIASCVADIEPYAKGWLVVGTLNLVVTYDPTFTPGSTTVLPIPDNTTTE